MSLSQSCSEQRSSIWDAVDVLKFQQKASVGEWEGLYRLGASFVCLFIECVLNIPGWISQLGFGQNHQNSYTFSYMKMTKCCWALYLRFVSSVSAKTNDCIAPTMPPSYNVITATSIIFIIFLLAITLAARYFPRHGKYSSFI